MATTSEPFSHSAERCGGLLVALGSAGVAITSACYALSPASTALPVVESRIPEALADAAGGASTMWAAGTAGMIGDVLFATGAVVLAMHALETRRPVAAAGWTALAISNLVFVVVDALVGRVLVPMAQLDTTGLSFHFAKRLFDALFVIGTFAFGVGSLLALVPGSLAPDARRWRLLTPSATILGAGAIVAAVLCLFGADLGQVLGLAITAGSLLFTIVGVQLAQSAAPATRRLVPASPPLASAS
jgi:hypothetical protein